MDKIYSAQYQVESVCGIDGLSNHKPDRSELRVHVSFDQRLTEILQDSYLVSQQENYLTQLRIFHGRIEMIWV